MFNLIKSVKKATGLSKKDLNSKQDSDKISEEQKQNTVSGKINKITDLFSNVVNQVVGEFNTVHEKSKNLSETNLKLGMKYLEEGNLSEAIFRFKITKKFWPDNYEASYQLILCLILDEKFEEAENLMKELSSISPEYKAKIEQNFGPHKEENKASDQIASNQNS